MNMIKKIRKILKGEAKLIDIWHYFLGWYRYRLYYAESTNVLHKQTVYRVPNPFMRKHIDEQITWRIRIMNPVCYEQGSCIKCGCETTALQMANKSCKGACYPPMMNKKQWVQFYCNGGEFSEDKSRKRVWIINKFTNKPDLFIFN